MANAIFDGGLLAKSQKERNRICKMILAEMAKTERTEANG